MTRLGGYVDPPWVGTTGAVALVSPTIDRHEWQLSLDGKDLMHGSPALYKSP